MTRSLRQLTRSEVDFERSTEPDDTPIEGNVLASGDAKLDQEAEREVLERLQNDDHSAWCGVVVRARWTSAAGVTYEGRASLWGCILTDRYSDADVARDHDLEGEALADLNARLARIVQSARDLYVELTGEPRPKGKRSPRAR